MAFDEGFVYGGLVLGMLDLVVTAAIATAVIRTLMRQRALESAFRLRMARWRRDAGIATE